MNNWFQFKQFRIMQEMSAMKVGTDGVLLGAWADVSNVKTILDAGTGTGIIALMMAQRSHAMITGVEIEEKAAREAAENASNSPWSNRVNIINTSLQNFSIQHQQSFDLVISNPPFFSNSKIPASKALAMAKHNHLLPYSELIECSNLLLSDKGRIALIVPADAYALIKKTADNNRLFLHRETEVKPNSLKKIHRFLLEFGKWKPQAIEKDVIMIHNDDGLDYTEKYKSITRQFYLKF